MLSSVTRSTCTTLLAITWCFGVFAQGSRAEQTDLDAFMRQVLASRDANWKKLQQYVLDERELMEVHGPGRILLWGERREYTWYIREGFFVRSPLKFNGVEIGDAERRKFEADYLKRMQARDKRRSSRGGSVGTDGVALEAPDRRDSADAPTPPDVAGDLPRDVDGLIRQTREPQFISSAYFLRFKFEEGKYALVGRETLDGRDVLRIEYYPTQLFRGTDRRRTGREPSAADKARDAQFQHLMNKVALVTLWVEPKAHQIVKYTFDNVGFGFLPGQWLVHVNDLKASMTMGQPFPDVWLPNALELALSGTLAVGQFDLRYRLDYHDYRRPDVTSKVGVKER
jgi:hypothetical protein